MSDVLRHISKKLNKQTGDVTKSEIAELCNELSAMKQRAEAAEAERIELHQLLSAETSAKFEYKRKLEAAEARIKEFERRCEAGYNKLDWLDANERILELEERIKASQEQEPSGWRVPYEHSETNYIHGVPNKQTLGYWDSQDIRLEYVYAAPVIPPDVAELQRENAELRNAITRYMRDSKRLVLSNEELTKLLAEAKSKAVPDDAVDNLNKILNWCDAYPLSVFPEPDFKRAASVLKESGMTIDAISASNMRHVLNGVKKYAQAAMLAAAPQPETGKEGEPT